MDFRIQYEESYGAFYKFDWEQLYFYTLHTYIQNPTREEFFEFSVLL